MTTSAVAPPSTRAAVIRSAGQGVQVERLELAAPRCGEITVQLAAAGVCHSDLSVVDQTLGSRYPIVLGHEGAGVVAAVGPDVTTVAPGDRVVLAWLLQCGHCFYCRRGQPALCESGVAGWGRSTLPDGTTPLSNAGAGVFQMLGLGCFAEYCVVPAAAALPIPDSLGFAQAALIGCGVLTGFGAAVNSATIAIGDTVVVVGCGGVGLNAIQGARVRGAARIIAIDPRPNRLELAKSFGATEGLQAEDSIVSTIRARTEGRGADVVIEAVGRSETIADAIRMTRRGGQSILVGAPAADVTVSIPAYSGLVTSEKIIRGSLYGSAHLARDVERVISLYDKGLLKLDELVTTSFGLDDMELAFENCAAGIGARTVIEF